VSRLGKPAVERIVYVSSNISRSNFRISVQAPNATG
jgi:hypothetical protein